MKTASVPNIPSEVRAAIGAFLNACQKEARPLATAEALGAVRRVFPDLDISDAALMDAISSEASAAGFHVEARGDTPSEITIRRSSLEEWDNEGGAIGKPPRKEGSAASKQRAKPNKD
ncbi:hypothetical protein SAZ10_32615 [Mesorhizobium sp. BAC0120]|uniref:hypothetical protein n=1 Tax=Mesorhizobium sp. BAC0120 TaxID=3090670 RepID=UPI00298C6297|nr:hypothetical protein [Mesorhizobium sp. BAC0120]MDW6026514.1 hypothetical protein [Mesorhizobium sp. BAC0120]